MHGLWTEFSLKRFAGVDFLVSCCWTCSLQKSYILLFPLWFGLSTSSSSFALSFLYLPTWSVKKSSPLVGTNYKASKYNNIHMKYYKYSMTSEEIHGLRFDNPCVAGKWYLAQIRVEFNMKKITNIPWDLRKYSFLFHYSLCSAGRQIIGPARLAHHTKQRLGSHFKIIWNISIPKQHKKGQTSSTN